MTSVHSTVGWLQTMFCYSKFNDYVSIKYLEFLDHTVKLINSAVRSKCLIR